MKIAYRPAVIDRARTDDPATFDDFVVENRMGMTLRCSEERALRLGFTADEIASARTLWPNDGFVACPRPMNKGA